MVDAIYRIHGDTLSIYCGARGRRPTAFRLDGADHVVTLKRVRQP
jgi:hypothetical protein